MSEIMSSALTKPNTHYCAISFYQGPYNNRCIHVVGLTHNEVTKTLQNYGNCASDRPIQYVDIAGYTPLHIANFLAETFKYQIISTSATGGEFVFVMERQT